MYLSFKPFLGVVSIVTHRRLELPRRKLGFDVFDRLFSVHHRVCLLVPVPPGKLRQRGAGRVPVGGKMEETATSSGRGGFGRRKWEEVAELLLLICSPTFVQALAHAAAEAHAAHSQRQRQAVPGLTQAAPLILRQGNAQAHRAHNPVLRGVRGPGAGDLVDSRQIRGRVGRVFVDRVLGNWQLY